MGHSRSRICLLHAALIGSMLRIVCSSCPLDFVAYGDGCFFASKEKATFAQCQHNVCGRFGASLAAITSDGLNAFLFDLLDGDVGFIGLYESGEDESGDWRWVDGTPSSYLAWHEGEPNNWCFDEDCAIFLPERNTKTWFDASCAIRVRCLCQAERTSSSDYNKMEAQIAATEPADYSQCGGGGRCFWQHSTVFRCVFLFVGFPCFLLLALVILSCCGVQINCQHERFNNLENECVVPSASYGFLLDASDVVNDVDSIVYKWIVRGACGAILYSFGLVALAVSMALHIHVAEFSFFVDAAEAFLMFASKLAVAVSAHIVHRHLSPVSRQVVGKWILVLACSKALMAAFALVLAFIYILVELTGTGGPVFCYVGYVFCWSLLTSNVFQSIAGLAFWRIHAGAVQYVGDERVFSNIVHCWFPVLVYGTFGVGVSLWTCGFLFVFDDVADGIEPVKVMPLLYLAAALSQLAAGIAMLMMNSMTQRHFRSEKGSAAIKAAIEMSASRAQNKQERPIGAVMQQG